MPDIVYKIPYRRARAWPSGQVRARAKESCIQCKIPLLAQTLGQARATIGYLVYNIYKYNICLILIYNIYNKLKNLTPVVKQNC